MQKLNWEDTKAIREALFHSRLDHESAHPPHMGSMQRIEEAEQELGRLLGIPGEWSYLNPANRADDHATQLRLAREQAVSEVTIGARDLSAAYAARQAQDGPHGVQQGRAQDKTDPTFYSPTEAKLAVQFHAPGKVFGRETIVAIIRAERTRPQSPDSLETLNRLQSTFENLE